MNKYTYHQDLKIILVGIGEMLNGVILKRYDGNNSDVVDEIAVPVLYSSKSRILHDIVNKSRHIKLPLLCYQYKGISYNSKQSFNKLDGYTLGSSLDKTGKQIPQPIPITISISTSFLARFQNDVDQYITCLFTNFYPYAVMSYKHPSNDTEVRCKVTWSGSANISEQDTLDANTPQRFEVNAEFTVEGWLFKNADSTVARIYDIHTAFTALPELSNEWLWMHNQEMAPDITDYLTLSGRPYVRDAYPTILDVSKNNTISVVGNMFETVTGIALVDCSGNASTVYPSSAYAEFDYYSDDKTLSSRVPAFTGVSAEFNILDDNHMVVDIPSSDGTGWIDIYALGEFGAGKLSMDSYREYMTIQPTTTYGLQLTGVEIPT